MTRLGLQKSAYASECSNFWGIDVGGANLKMCAPSGRCAVRAFPMWTEFNRLGPSVAGLISDLGDWSHEDSWNEHSMLAVTMTGELADCFETRRIGVKTILDQLESVLPRKQLVVYGVDGRWMSLDQAIAFPWSVAASNWHVLASWCLSLTQIAPARFHAIIDIGSTTVDIIPTQDGKILTGARTDRQRMELGQLVYTGMERTPIHAIVRSLQVHGVCCPVMAERFATIADANVVLACVPEEPDNCDTADGRPMTRLCLGSLGSYDRRRRRDAIGIRNGAASSPNLQRSGQTGPSCIGEESAARLLPPWLCQGSASGCIGLRSWQPNHRSPWPLRVDGQCPIRVLGCMGGYHGSALRPSSCRIAIMLSAVISWLENRSRCVHQRSIRE